MHYEPVVMLVTEAIPELNAPVGSYLTIRLGHPKPFSVTQFPPPNYGLVAGLLDSRDLDPVTPIPASVRLALRRAVGDDLSLPDRFPQGPQPCESRHLVLLK